MSIATLIRSMSAAGAPPEAIALAVEAIEEAEQKLADKRAIDRDRKRAQRQRERDSHGTVTGQSEDKTDLSPTLSPSLPPDPQPNPIPTPVKDTPRAKGARLSADWEPIPLKGQAAEMVKRWPPGSIEREWAKFQNYWFAKSGKDATKLDWQKTWVNWLISADERIGNGRQGNCGTVIRPQRFERAPNRAEEMDIALRDLGFGN